MGNQYRYTLYMIKIYTIPPLKPLGLSHTTSIAADVPLLTIPARPVSDGPLQKVPLWQTANQAFLLQPAQRARNRRRFHLEITNQIGLGNAVIQVNEVQDHPFRAVKS